MANAWSAGGAELVGREADLTELVGIINNVCAGTARTYLVTGDAGIGKTALVTRAIELVPPNALVLSGGALPLSSMDVPFLALRSAFRAAEAGTTRPVPPAPALSGDSRPDVLVLIDEWLTALCRLSPVILTIDDLHWADQSTLDVLMYLVAGPSDRPLGVIGTVRTDEGRAGGTFHRWMTDVRRMPRVDIRPLEPLDRPDTEAQLGRLLDAPPHQSLVTDVFDRSAGNPYLNRLLVAGLTAESRRLPAGFPPDLKSAVLRAWRGLSSGARELTQVMALGGRPASSTELVTVAGSAVGPAGVLPLLQSAVEEGLLDVTKDGKFWFHHPIIAEALEQGLDEGERKRWHAAFAAVHQQRLGTGPAPPAGDAVALADHYAAADRPAEARRWSIVAADMAAAQGGLNDAIRLLRRAIRLQAVLPDASEWPRDLWAKLRSAAREAGALALELEATEELLAHVDPVREPLEASELIVRRMHLQFSTGQAFLPMADIREAVCLSAEVPGSWQHAMALAEFAHASMWHGEPGADTAAVKSLAMAREAGDHRALAYALTAAAIAELGADRFAAARSLAAEGAREALRARDFWAFVHATYWTGNSQDPWTSEEYADLLARARQELMQQGAPHAYTAKIAATEAASYLAIGSWRKCRAALRIAMGLDPGPMGDVDARLTAARLAHLQGRHDEAGIYLARAEELYKENSVFLNLTFDAVRAEVHVAAGRPGRAFSAAMAGATSPGPPPTMCEWLLPIAARALADQIRQARDHGLPASELLEAATQLQDRFPEVLHERMGHSELYKRQVAAFNALYIAELGRARDEAGSAVQWGRTADALRDALLPWEEAYACRRAVEALLLHGHHRAPRAAEYLHRGLVLAAQLEAAPVQAVLELLAAQARIPLTPVNNTPLPFAARLPGLTPRELDVLNYVMAGRTYGEIARALMISEKTVSSHVSNLLRKTGAANRVDLARLAAADAPVSRNSGRIAGSRSP